VAAIVDPGLTQRLAARVDPVSQQMAMLLECPRLALDRARGRGGNELLDSRCNFR
jgi:hypothetical protein